MCESLSATDPLVLGWAVALVMLLLPDLRELEVGGVFRLRRAVQEVREESREVRRELAEVRLATSATSGAQAVVQMGPDAAGDLREIAAGSNAPLPGPTGLLDVAPSAPAAHDGPGYELSADQEQSLRRFTAFTGGFHNLSSVLPVAAEVDVALQEPVGYGFLCDVRGRLAQAAFAPRPERVVPPVEDVRTIAAQHVGDLDGDPGIIGLDDSLVVIAPAWYDRSAGPGRPASSTILGYFVALYPRTGVDGPQEPASDAPAVDDDVAGMLLDGAAEAGELYAILLTGIYGVTGPQPRR